MKKLALVLAGGGSLGAYEVGAIEALNELGYSFDIVTGTSIGAINGAFVCNKQTEKLRGLWENITPEKVMVEGINLSRREFDDSVKKMFIKEIGRWGKQYLKGGKLGADITPFKEYIKGCVDIDACLNSNIRYGIVTTKLSGMKLVDVDMQQVAKDQFLSYLHASSACFPIFPMEKIDGKNYVDGFYKDNLPIRLAFNMGADNIIAIDMKLFSLEPQHRFYLSLPNVEYIAPYSKMGSLMDFSQEVIRNNMKLGYNDVMKHYGRYLGFTYTFEKFEIESHFLSFVLRDFETDSKFIVQQITDGIRRKMDERDYFVRAMEIIAINLGINDYYHVYTFEEFKDLLIERIRTQIRERSISSIKDRIGNLATYRSDNVMFRFLTEFARINLGIDVEQEMLSADLSNAITE